MKTSMVLLLALACAAAANARPLVIQESARIANPVPDLPNVVAADIDGDDAIVALRRHNPGDAEGSGQSEDIATWLFRRVGGTWTAVRELDRVQHPDYYMWGVDLAMENGVAALARNPLTIFERRNGDWVRVVSDALGDEPGTSVEIDNGRVLFGGSSGTYMGSLFERDAAGAWRLTAQMFGDVRGGDIENSGGQVDISGTQAVIVSRSIEDDQNPELRVPSVAIHQYTPTYGWSRNYLLRDDPSLYPLFQFDTESAVRGNEIFIAGPNTTGTHVFRPVTTPSQFSYWPYDHLQPLDGFMGAGRTGMLKKNDLFVMQLSYSWDRQANVIQVFAKNGEGNYENVATLAASSGDSLGAFGISGRRVIASCGGSACVFEIPTSLSQPATAQDTFAGLTPGGWSLSAGSQFTITQSGASRVLRQAETASTATHTALLEATATWRNEAIEADLRPTAFNGNDRWFGLATRYRDASNYYYVTLRSSGTVSLKKLVNGAFMPLASTPLAVTLNRSYRVRLESIGTRHRVYVDGIALLDADDATFASGRAGLLTYRTAAQFDNVVVSPTPAVTDYADDFSTYHQDAGWTASGGLWSNAQRGTNRVYEQSSVAGDARIFVGVPTDAQTIEARVRPTTFAGTGGGERWFGLAARYSDVNNYYYLSLRSSSTASLRKRVDGQISVLGTAALPVALGSSYTLRLEAVGTQVRAYVNGTLLLEASDDSLARGVGGLVTYRAAADFDDFRFVQP